MKSSRLIQLGVLIVIVFFAVVYISTGDDSNDYKVKQTNPITKPLKTESVSGDSTADSYAALTAKMQQSLEETDKIKKENKSLKSRLSNMDNQIKKAINIALRATEKPNKAIASNVNQEIIDPVKIEQLTNNSSSSNNAYKIPSKESKSVFQMPGNYSLEDGLGLSNKFFSSSKLNNNTNLNSNTSRVYDKNDPNRGWVMPIETKNYSEKKNKTKPIIKKDTNHPAMTISDNSILYNSVALTYLVGRIPVDGVVDDPYPVKFLVGTENLLANGYELPGVEGMFFSGTATGDMNLSCVRATLNSYTFIFDDGRQVSFREKGSTGTSDAMAYISDNFGLPCVLGKFVSNAAEYLAIQAGLSGLSAAGSAYAAAQTTTVTSTDRTISSITGSLGEYALGTVASEAFTDTSAWLTARQENSFDAVVVPSGTQVSIHLNRDILIDYNEAARKVNYNYQISQTTYLD